MSLLLMLLALLLLLLLPEIWVLIGTWRRSWRQIDTLPPCDDALILGTAKYLPNGGCNAYYQYRIQAATDLWHSGKVMRFIVSGNGLTSTISETASMQADLLAAGVPAEVIWQDEGGMRTLDSVLRYANTFDSPRGQRRLCIVSQPFHNRRALLLARWQQVNALAYDAQTVSLRGGWQVQLRERGARWRLLWDRLRHTPPQHSLSHLPLRQCPTQTTLSPPPAA